jgi:protein-L-isoaspartate(D-aspartate) O-methyltransferase
LVQTILSKGIRDERVLTAIDLIPRHFFLDNALDEHAYQDKAMPIGNGQTISQPYTVAYQTHHLEVAKGMKVLEIGTGSGYQGCILCALGAQLYTVERLPELLPRAAAMFSKFGFNPQIKIGDGSLGWPEMAPFDRIIVTAAAPGLGKSLWEQLRPGGIILLPMGNKVQIMNKIRKTHDGQPIRETLDSFRFVPLIGSEGYSE